MSSLQSAAYQFGTCSWPGGLLRRIGKSGSIEYNRKKYHFANFNQVRIAD
ncbi:MAG: hypothetical protein FWG73_08975 [Planctomycetaceae bacterium]|nr:hypothetical protein [Planctomycetaceae bacterium]